ncbi:hypothetical protein Pint_20101 [Pistacia integerrima]|uniref:Uncharacterized protein n=1 Tax=Pistacia integerrima TaxID=434235 RepID=A0ACC0XB00_9ROSI|nr:hypothetical protein Pint_20101 [Pistacia integerrima]
MMFNDVKAQVEDKDVAVVNPISSDDWATPDLGGAQSTICSTGTDSRTKMKNIQHRFIYMHLTNSLPMLLVLLPGELVSSLEVNQKGLLTPTAVILELPFSALQLFR